LINFDAQLLHDTILLALAMLVLFIALSYLLFEPVRKMLANRQERIANDINAAEIGKRDALAMKAEYEAKLMQANREVDVILGDARTKGLKNAARIESEAKEEASRIIERASQEADLEKKRAMDEMKREMIVIASLMAAKMVSASIDPKVQDGLVEETLREIGDRTWLG
jgi:F-type H+-transporting ATPase subunit b